MKYITIEELERRKSFLTDKIKQAQADFDKEIPNSIERYILQKEINGAKDSISEINFLIAYIEMKEDSSFKAINCVDCKKFGKCKVREKSLVWGFGHCGLFEQKEKK